MKRSIEPAPARLIWAAQPIAARAVVVFIHGLDGHTARTWGQPGQAGAFIERLQHDLPQVAVAAYDYPSALRAIVADSTLTLQSQANRLAECLRETLLPNFQSVIVIAHCLGGLLTTLALRHLIEQGDLSNPPNSTKQVLLFLLDTPHDLPASGPSQWLTGLLGAVSLTPAALAANADFWRQTVLAAPNSPGSVSSVVSAYAVVSTQPSWVSHLKPDLELPADRVCRLELPHEALTHAPLRDAHDAAVAAEFAPYDFILEKLRAHLQVAPE